MNDLHNYRRKRDFSRTSEPSGQDGAPTNGRAIFVVQLHHASSTHFDFRLQVGDVLKSWDVPKGPSFDPTMKRLAVEVEDHPLLYGGFEGDIEHGYGKGHVDQFDTGVWTTAGDAEAQLQNGHLRFELFGKRLKGGWHLVRSARKQAASATGRTRGDAAALEQAGHIAQQSRVRHQICAQPTVTPAFRSVEGHGLTEAGP